MAPRSLRVETRKWPDEPHWEFDAFRLGADAHGIWVGVPEGTLLSKPTRAFHATADHVVLIPHDAWWLGTFYGSDLTRPFDVYVDITTPAQWISEDLVKAVDLDLDVARRPGEEAFLDDEDEFALHRVTLNYPPEVIQNAERSAVEIMAAVQSMTPPFDGLHLEWLARLRSRLAQS
jgi:predicted RNA-binding protein associated with RNAse of E/G family